VTSWILKKFNDDSGKPLDLVNKSAAEKYGYPLSLWTYDETLRNKLSSVLYVPSATGEEKAPADITFEYSDSDIAVRKSFHFDHTYVVKVETSVLLKGMTITAFPMWPAGFGDETSPTLYAASKIEYQNDGDVERLAIKKVVGGSTIRGPFNWAGVIRATWRSSPCATRWIIRKTPSIRWKCWALPWERLVRRPWRVFMSAPRRWTYWKTSRSQG
jgi:YidC/Oxa1 family membrane protein insertase